jgi:glutathione S-transferase
MQLLLYYAPNACSLVPYVTLTEAGAPFEVRPLNFRRSQHMTTEYLQVNPKHKVPVLVIDGAPLTENVAIQIWIARNFPLAKLLPAEPMQELRAISLLVRTAADRGARRANPRSQSRRTGAVADFHTMAA